MKVKVDKEEFLQKTGLNFDEIDSSLFKKVDLKAEESEHIASKPYSYWKSVFRLLFRNWTFIIAMMILIVIVVLAIVVPIGHEATPLMKPNPIDPNNPLEGPQNPFAPSWDFIFGSGPQGEDYWIKIWSGVRTTLGLAALLTVVQIAFGVLFGSIWGYFGKTDILFVQITNLLTVVPQLILLLFMIFIMGSGYWPVVLGVSIQAWIGIATIVRVQIMLVKNTDYNTASISLGSGSGRIIGRNIMPKILPVIVQAGSFAIPNAIGIDSSLSFLGASLVDGQVKTSLGTIINEVMSETKWQVFPHLILIPLAITVLISAIFFLVAKVFADSLDPKNHR